MSNYLKLLVVLINILVYYFTEIVYVDIFVAYMIIFNILTLIVFNLFEFRSFNILDEKNLKAEIYEGIQANIKNPYNWILVFTPLFFLFFESSYVLSPISYIFFIVIILNLFFNISVLNFIIFKLYEKKYFYYIIANGIIFQFVNMFFDFSVEKLFFIGCFYVILSYLSILFIYIKKNKTFKLA